MRERRFQRRAVRHQRACQIGKVLFAEKGKRELTELFRKRHAAHGTLLIGRKIGRIILPPCGQENQHKRRRNPHDVNPVMRFRHAAAVKIVYQQIQKTDGKHQNDIGKRAGSRRFDKILRAVSRKRVFFHQKIYHTAPPTFQLTEV